MYMKLKDGKSKVFTLSYDDGVTDDTAAIQAAIDYAAERGGRLHLCP